MDDAHLLILQPYYFYNIGRWQDPDPDQNEENLQFFFIFNIFNLQVLQPLVSELKELEEEGIAGVAAYCGDNLELHELGMFHRAFNGGHVCRFCTIHYSELRTSDGFIRHKLWDEDTYDTIASAIENEEEVENFSLRGRCVLNELESFHASKSLAPDIMHDFLEGTIP